MIFDSFPTTHFGNCFLFDLLSEFSIDYNTNFSENFEILIIKIIQIKIFPLPSFWKLFDFDLINNFYNDNDKNPIMKCALQFSCGIHTVNPITKLTIQPFLNEKNENLILDLLKTGDFTILKNLDDELITFISSCMIYSNQEKRQKLKV